jgi:hypothetical protein
MSWCGRCRKRAYDNALQAQAAIQRHWLAGDFGSASLHVYWCAHLGAYHVGHRR